MASSNPLVAWVHKHQALTFMGSIGLLALLAFIVCYIISLVEKKRKKPRTMRTTIYSNNGDLERQDQTYEMNNLASDAQQRQVHRSRFGVAREWIGGYGFCAQPNNARGRSGITVQERCLRCWAFNRQCIGHGYQAAERRRLEKARQRRARERRRRIMRELEMANGRDVAWLDDPLPTYEEAVRHESIGLHELPEPQSAHLDRAVR